MKNPANDNIHPLAKRFFAFIEDADFPCVGAKSALARDQMHVVIARDIASAWDDLPIHQALMAFAQGDTSADAPFRSLAVLFETPRTLSETAFEQCLWDRVQSLSDKDDWLGQPLDPRVSPDPDDPHFSLSFGGEAFFVVGLHPGASRPARRFERPALIFNLHAQFEALRQRGQYDKMRGTIIARDVKLAGAPNPMLAQHGSISEARQYSGRAVDSDWTCPFSGRMQNAG